MVSRDSEGTDFVRGKKIRKKRKKLPIIQRVTGNTTLLHFLRREKNYLPERCHNILKLLRHFQNGASEKFSPQVNPVTCAKLKMKQQTPETTAYKQGFPQPMHNTKLQGYLPRNYLHKAPVPTTHNTCARHQLSAYP